MFESLSAGISKQGEKLFHLLLDTGKDEEQSKFAAGVEVVLKILGNFVFLVLLTITIGWLTTLLIAALPDWVTLFFQNLKLGSTVWIYIGMAILYLYLVVSSLALLIRKFVQIYKLTEVYAFVEIVNLVVSNPGDSFVSKMLAAMEVMI
ncbi:MAG: hypothetical protein IPP17_28105 [Bacteroidetes bacterium]|nr:hypothetical protein [Bacteroidota bacterium]